MTKLREGGWAQDNGAHDVHAKFDHLTIQTVCLLNILIVPCVFLFLAGFTHTFNRRAQTCHLSAGNLNPSDEDKKKTCVWALDGKSGGTIETSASIKDIKGSVHCAAMYGGNSDRPNSFAQCSRITDM